MTRARFWSGLLAALLIGIAATYGILREAELARTVERLRRAEAEDQLGGGAQVNAVRETFVATRRRCGPSSTS
jgi:hypothetical protein